MPKVSKQALLVEKASGDYSCPHYVDPKCGRALLSSCGLDGSDEAVKQFTEIIENFGIELASSLNSPITRDALDEVVQRLEFGK